MNKQLVLSGVALTCAMLMSSTARAVVIDEFSQGTQTIGVSPAGVGTHVASEGQVGAFNSTIIGGYRELRSFVLEQQDGTKSLDVQIANPADAGLVFSHNQGSGLRAYTEIVWDGVGGDFNDVNQFAAQNLALNGETHFEFGVLNADLGIQWELQLFDSDSNFALQFSTAAEISSFQALLVPFSAFSGIDFADIRRIEFRANYEDTQFAVDTTVSYIRTVPEPLTLGLFGIGLVGAGAVRRRWLI